MNYTKIVSGWGSAPDPPGVAYTYSASIAFMAGIKLLWEFELEGLISNYTEINTYLGWFGFFQILFKMI